MQVADNPGRFEPGTGEINYHAVAKAMKTMGYVNSKPPISRLTQTKDNLMRFHI